MDAKAPITPDVLTIPRKALDGPQNLIGLSRDQMRDALIALVAPIVKYKGKRIVIEYERAFKMEPP